MTQDPFSHFLGFMSARSVLSGALVAGGPWALHIPPPDRIKFWGVVRGSCWLALDGEDAPIRVEQGDVFLRAGPRSLVLASDLTTQPVELYDMLEERTGTLSHLGEGDDFFMIGGQVEFGPDCEQMLLDALPPFIHIKAMSKQAQTLHWLMDQLVQERADDLPGAAVASAQLAHLMFIQILRAHFDASEPLAAGWLRAVSDKRLAPALRLMHGDPARSWQLGELATAAAMSRATFASYFKRIAGTTPLAYLTQWRMRLAERSLRDGKTPVGVLAESLGYASASAFSNAFKRVTGSSPKGYLTRPERAWIAGVDQPRSGSRIPQRCMRR